MKKSVCPSARFIVKLLKRFQLNLFYTKNCWVNFILNSVSNLGGPGFRSRPEDSLSRLKAFSWFSLVPQGKFRDINLTL
jgi:hypothetical protein